jgi:hypothetical protein
LLQYQIETDFFYELKVQYILVVCSKGGKRE